MPPTPSPTSPPEGLPRLSRGRHRDPSRGACFMEYTSVLAGEPFSDAPRCVDPELAAILRSANDTLSEGERPALIPLLGRAIGLVVPRSDHDQSWFQRLRHRARGDDDGAGALTSRLHATVAQRFVAVVGLPTSRAWARWYGHYAHVSELFWDLMSEPGSARSSEDYAGRLVARLDLLHRCYEEALAELGLPVATAVEAAAAPAVPTASSGSSASSGPAR